MYVCVCACVRACVRACVCAMGVRLFKITLGSCFQVKYALLPDASDYSNDQLCIECGNIHSSCLHSYSSKNQLLYIHTSLCAIINHYCMERESWNHSWRLLGVHSQHGHTSVTSRWPTRQTNTQVDGKTMANEFIAALLDG